MCEASSFQLASCQAFAPEVAVLLNITPDHLYWHMTFEAYAEAKKQVYANLGKNQGTLVIDAMCDVTRDCVKEFKNDPKRAFDYIPVGCAAGIEDAALEYAELDRKQQTASPAKACKRAAWPHDAISDSTMAICCASISRAKKWSSWAKAIF